MLYRFTLEEITCEHQRGADQYRDAIAIAFAAWHVQPMQGKVERQLLAVKESPLGLQGPNRWGPLFGPGTVQSLAPDPNRFGLGFDEPWSLEVDVPESPTSASIELEVLVRNQRGVDDPYAFSRVFMAVATAAMFGAAGSAATESAKGAVAVLLSGLYSGAEEGAQKVLELIFGDTWPKCAGTVFSAQQTFTKDIIAGFTSPMTLQSKKIDDVPSGCGQPSYSVRMSFERVAPPDFGDRLKRVSTRYEAIVQAQRSDWIGTWRSSADVDSDVAVTIVSTKHIGGIDQIEFDTRDRFDAYVSERLTDGSDLHEHTEVGPVTATDEGGIPYTGQTTKGMPKLVVLPVDRGPVGGVAQRGRIDRVMASTQGPMISLIASDGETVGSLRPELLRGAAGGDIDLFGAITRLSDDVAVSEIFVSEDTSTLAIPQLGITLRLYKRVDTMDSGQEVSHAVVHYSRTSTSWATRSEFELARHKILT